MVGYLEENGKSRLAEICFKEDPKYMLNSVIARIKDTQGITVVVRMRRQVPLGQSYMFLCSVSRKRIDRALVVLPELPRSAQDDLIRDRLFPSESLVRRFMLGHELAHLELGHYRRHEQAVLEQGKMVDIGHAETIAERRAAHCFSALLLKFHGRVKCRANLSEVEIATLLGCLDPEVQLVSQNLRETAHEVWHMRPHDRRGTARNEVLDIRGAVGEMPVREGRDYSDGGLAFWVKKDEEVALPLHQDIAIDITGSCRLQDDTVVDFAYKGAGTFARHGTSPEGDKTLLAFSFDPRGEQ